MPQGTSYPPADVDRGLLALITTGSSNVASDQTGIPPSTLKHWRHAHAQRYQELAEKHKAEVEDILVQQARRSALMAGDLEEAVFEQLAQKLPDLDAKELAGTARNLSTSKGINVDKLLVLTGRPSQVTEHRSTDDLMRKLESLKVKAIDSTAEEIPTSRLIGEARPANTRETEDQHS